MFDFTEMLGLGTLDFYRIVRPNDTRNAVPCAVLANREGIPNIYRWPQDGEDTNAFMARLTKGWAGGYFSPATFTLTREGTRKRGVRFVQAVKAVWLDIEGTEAKGGYEGQEAVLAALHAFVQATYLTPTVIVLTGSGGAHAYFAFDRELPPDDWKGYAEALVALAERHGLKIDAPITTDPSRIMRAPGSIHRKTGATVKAYRTGDVYSLEELGKLLNHVPDRPQTGRWLADDLRINADLKLDDDAPRRHTPFSMLEVSKHCAAVRMAIANRGETTPYQPWVLALQMAVLSVEGEELGHAISEGHPDYNEDAVAAKMTSFAGGPPSCETWHRAWGRKSPCPNCLYGGIGQ